MTGTGATARPGWLGRASCGVALAATLVGAASWFHPPVDGSDLWWHLASGRLIAERTAVPLTDPFSHTAAGQPWTNHSWLWGLLYWIAYDGHPDGAAWLNLALLVAVFALVARNARSQSGSWLAAGGATWLAAAACHWYLDLRPHVFTLLFSALLLASLERRRAVWLWPLGMALWANLHAGFAFGLGVLFLHSLVSSVTAWRRGAPPPRAPWLGLLAALLAAAANPWGFAIYGVPFEPLDSATPFRRLTEWQPFAPSLDPRSYAGRFGWLALLSLLGVMRARRDPFPVALAAVTAVMALSARRFVPLFAVCAAPLAALGIGVLLDALRRRLPAASRPPWAAAAPAAALLAALWLWRGVDFLPRPLQRWTTGESYPSGAAAYLAAMPDPPRRLFNFYDWGGYLALHAPGVPVFIDGRAGTVYADRIGRDYFGVMDARPGWQRTLRAHGVDAVLVPTGSSLAVRLRRQRPAWRVAHVDPRSVLLFPPADRARPELPEPEQLLPDAADLALARGHLARRRGDLDGAIGALQAAQRMDPLQIYAYAELMRVAAAREDLAGIHRQVEAALRAYPRRWDPIWGFAEHAYGEMGACDARLDALRKLRHAGPFVTDALESEIRARLDAFGAPDGPAADLGCIDRADAPAE